MRAFVKFTLRVRITVHGVSSYDVTGAQRRLESNEVIHKANNNHQHPADSTTDDRDDEQTVYVIEFESESNEKVETLQNKGKGGPTGKRSPLININCNIINDEMRNPKE